MLVTEQTPVAAPGRPQVRVAASSGHVVITAEARDDVEVVSKDGPEHRSCSAGEVVDIKRSGTVELRCPLGTDVVAGTSSGKVRLEGELGDVRVTSQSGAIRVAPRPSADLRTTSGSVEVQHCEGSCRITTTSGTVRIDGAGDADVSGGSGTVERDERPAGFVPSVAPSSSSPAVTSPSKPCRGPSPSPSRPISIPGWVARAEATEDRCRRRGRQRCVGAFAQWLDHRSIAMTATTGGGGGRHGDVHGLGRLHRVHRGAR